MRCVSTFGWCLFFVLPGRAGQMRPDAQAYKITDGIWESGSKISNAKQDELPLYSPLAPVDRSIVLGRTNCASFIHPDSSDAMAAWRSEKVLPGPARVADDEDSVNAIIATAEQAIPGLGKKLAALAASMPAASSPEPETETEPGPGPGPEPRAARRSFWG